jgi:regulator of nucleoside diphosphate kinase
MSVHPNVSLRSHQFRKPTVYVTPADHERLSNLADSRSGLGAAILGDELVRAVIVPDGETPRRDFVRLHSLVEFSDLTTGRTRRVQVVPPDEADIDTNRLSVLTPVGAGLIGLTAGDSIGIRTEDGRTHILAVVSVAAAEAAA